MTQRSQRSQNLRIAHLGFRPAAKIAIESGRNFILPRDENLNQALEFSATLGGIRKGISKVSRALPEERGL